MKSKFGEFSGTPKTTWLTESGPDRHMTLDEDFSFKRPDAEWLVPKGYKIDGASIPRVLWSLIGSPYTGDYRRASIVHDKACDDAKGDRQKRRAADRMFYHACRAGGCSWWQATILYVGVRVGAALGDVPDWRSVAKSEADIRLTRSRAEVAVERDFRTAAEAVLSEGETEDADEVERRADQALSAVTGLRFETL